MPSIGLDNFCAHPNFPCARARARSRQLPLLRCTHPSRYGPLMKTVRLTVLLVCGLIAVLAADSLLWYRVKRRPPPYTRKIPRLEWTRAVDPLYLTFTPPLIAKDGTLYVASAGGVHALNASSVEQMGVPCQRIRPYPQRLFVPGRRRKSLLRHFAQCLFALLLRPEALAGGLPKSRTRAKCRRACVRCRCHLHHLRYPSGCAQQIRRTRDLAPAANWKYSSNGHSFRAAAVAQSRTHLQPGPAHRRQRHARQHPVDVPFPDAGHGLLSRLRPR